MARMPPPLFTFPYHGERSFRDACNNSQRCVVVPWEASRSSRELMCSGAFVTVCDNRAQSRGSRDMGGMHCARCDRCGYPMGPPTVNTTARPGGHPSNRHSVGIRCKIAPLMLPSTAERSAVLTCNPSRDSLPFPLLQARGAVWRRFADPFCRVVDRRRSASFCGLPC